MEESEEHKRKGQLKFYKAINDRIDQERQAEQHTREVKRNIDKDHLEENEMSQRVAIAIKDDKQNTNMQREAGKNYMKNFLQNQIYKNKERASKDMEVKEMNEKMERKRLEDLLDAEKQQVVYHKHEMQDKISNYKLAKTNFLKVKEKSENTDSFAFLDESWQMEEIKTKDIYSEENRRKQVNMDCFTEVQKQMAKHQATKTEDNEAKLIEVQDRHLFEKEYKTMIEKEKNEDLHNKEMYRQAVFDLVDQNKRDKEKLDMNEQIKFADMKNRWLDLQSMDKREAGNPIERWHPTRKLT